MQSMKNATHKLNKQAWPRRLAYKFSAGWPDQRSALGLLCQWPLCCNKNLFIVGHTVTTIIIIMNLFD